MKCTNPNYSNRMFLQQQVKLPPNMVFCGDAYESITPVPFFSAADVWMIRAKFKGNSKRVDLYVKNDRVNELRRKCLPVKFVKRIIRKTEYST